jgi:prepilin-type N-terminal cleavage/methylation domain-containing protein
MLNKNFGFTLIELLVVIAIIGILASVILASLSDARESGVSAKIKSEMSSLAKMAYIEESKNLTYDTVCGTNGYTQSSNIADIITSINTFASSSVVCNSDISAFAASVPLDSDYWCVDSTGIAKSIPAELTTELQCP